MLDTIGECLNFKYSQQDISNKMLNIKDSERGKIFNTLIINHKK